MRGLRKRVGDLEHKVLGGFKPWHRIIQHECDGETQEQAIAKYEAENGPLGEDDALIVRIIKPGKLPHAEPA